MQQHLFEVITRMWEMISTGVLFTIVGVFGATLTILSASAWYKAKATEE